jgi:hypothetical protein
MDSSRSDHATEFPDQQTSVENSSNLPRESHREASDQEEGNVGEPDETVGLILGMPRERESLHSRSRRWSKKLKKSFQLVMPYCVCIVVIGGVFNFMVFLVLWVQDYDLFKDIRAIWIPAQCRILMRACACTCCMIQPAKPCHCYGRSDHCSVYCPIRNPQPPLDANCSVPGRVVRSMDSYWRPGSPSCSLKYHSSILVEYALAPNDHVVVAAAYEVASHQGAAGRACGRGFCEGAGCGARRWHGEGEGGPACCCCRRPCYCCFRCCCCSCCGGGCRPCCCCCC